MLGSIYSIIGCVIDGMKVVQNIANISTDKEDKPVKQIQIKKINTISESRCCKGK
jgi:cyclophilin family peptidyl-prolyl cis-trans isomerase